MCPREHPLPRTPRGVTTNNRAFTLVELLIVIGIIALLVAILLPALNQARASARTVACASNVRQVMTAITLYANDNAGLLPPLVTDPTTYPGIGYNDWSGVLVANRYLGDGNALTCPADDLPRSTTGLTLTNPVPRSYGANDMRYNETYLSGAGFHFPWPHYTLAVPDTRPPRLRQIPSHVLIVGENTGAIRALAGTSARAFVSVPEWESLYFRAALVHKRRGNYGFSDGRVETLAASEIDPFRADTDNGNALGDRWKWK